MTTTESVATAVDTADTVDPSDGPSKRPRERREPHPLPSSVFVTAWAMITVAGLALWCVAFGLAFSGLVEHRSQNVMYAQLREQLALATAPIGGSAPAGAPVALITAPGAGLSDVVVVQGTTSSELIHGPGHRADTPMPGQAGISVLMGRSVTYGAPFASIAALRPGTDIVVTTGQGRFTYRVDRTRRPGDPVPAYPAAGGGRLVLMSASDGGWRTGWAPHQTVLVDATLQGTAVAEPAGRPAAVTEASKPMHGQPAALVPLVLWLQALVLAAGACVWAHLRWGRRETWLVGFPLLLALLWGATATASLLLPNLV